MDEGRAGPHEGRLLLRGDADERNGPGGPLAIEDPAVNRGAEKLDDWNVVAPEAGLGQHRLLAERQAVQTDVHVAAVADGDGPADGRPHLQLVQRDEEVVVEVGSPVAASCTSMVPLETASSPSIHSPDDMLGLMVMSRGNTW